MELFLRKGSSLGDVDEKTVCPELLAAILTHEIPVNGEPPTVDRKQREQRTLSAESHSFFGRPAPRLIL